jgi:hypothetical protein
MYRVILCHIMLVYLSKDMSFNRFHKRSMVGLRVMNLISSNNSNNNHIHLTLMICISNHKYLRITSWTIKTKTIFKSHNLSIWVEMIKRLNLPQVVNSWLMIEVLEAHNLQLMREAVLAVSLWLTILEEVNSLMLIKIEVISQVILTVYTNNQILKQAVNLW